MAEDLTIDKTGTRQQQYEALLPQIVALLAGEHDLIANLANTVAALKEQFGWLWVGFYLIKQNELVLAPFQGPVACTRIKKGRGVCGAAWAGAKPIVVADVDQFPGHIACSSASKSEIVLPFYRGGVLVGVLDIDSHQLNDFNDVDLFYLNKLLKYLDA